jgi:molybdate transport system ATP-binding protein
VRDTGLPVGRRVRVRILARDVSLALEHQAHTSIQNLLPGRVAEVSGESHPALSLVRVQVGDSAVIARVTRRSVSQLGLAPGRAVWVQVKSVALIG